MEGSSEFGWQKSDSRRGLNTSRVSENIGSRKENRIGSLGDTGKEREKTGLAPVENPRNKAGLMGIQGNVVESNPYVRGIEWGDVSLRHWVDRPERAVDAVECLHIFRQIVEIVNIAHAQGVVVQNVKPSCFIMSTFNNVSFIESASCSDSGSDDGLNVQTVETTRSSSPLPLDMLQQRTSLGHVTAPANALSGSSQMRSSAVVAARLSLVEESEENKIRKKNIEQVEEKSQVFPMKQILAMETTWYNSPEELAGGPSSCASDIYRLGVLLFELFCPLSSWEEKCRTMSSLRHRVLPPQLLLKWPKEASFCLWLLHPEPTSRPKLSDLLQSEFLNESRDKLEERESAIELKERMEDQDMLSEFLLLSQRKKQEAATNLQNIIYHVSADVEEVLRKRSFLNRKVASCPELVKEDCSISNFSLRNVVDTDDSVSLSNRKRVKRGSWVNAMEEGDDSSSDDQKSNSPSEYQEGSLSKDSRLMKNFKKLESAYLLTRFRPSKPSGKLSLRTSSVSSGGRGSGVVTERSSVNNLTSKNQHDEDKRVGWINPFLESLCKYLSFSKLKVKADLKQGDLLNSTNLVCSLGFDRDGEFFASAGVNKKIKVFEWNTIMNDDRDIHYPVVEMVSRSKLSSICWNTYIKGHIASSNFEGVAQIWDVTRGQVVTEMREHEKRVWSVDFSSVDPTLLATGSDDCSVKLWNINQAASIGTIKTKANVCCVQFPMDSGRSLAFGSADHVIYYYDLRSAKYPLYTFHGHGKTVSYVKFVDATSFVSSSTDNTIKLWDLSMCTSQIIDAPAETFTGHTNYKNFVGLSVADGYIATGSETNEVFVYHKAFPMPAMSFKFNNPDPLSGHEVDDTQHFISSVCWRGQTSTLVAANSTGNIRILEMV